MRRLPFAAGVLLLCAAWSPWTRDLAVRYFTAHMAVHMTVVAMAAPLFAVSLPRTAFRGGLSPIPASLVELIVVWAWHVPALHHAASIHPAIFAVEQLSFLASGLLLWVSVRHAAGAGIVALLVTFAHMTLLGAILSLSPRVLYRHDTMAEALVDQQIGGTLMLAVSTVVYTAAGVWLGYVSLHRERLVRT